MTDVLVATGEDGGGEVVLGMRDGIWEGEAIGQKDGDGRGESAAGAMKVMRVDA